MNKQVRAISFLFVCVVFSSCATTDVTSFKDPEFADVQFSKIAVYANTGNLEWRTELETLMAERIGENGGNAIPSLLIIPPTGNQTVEEAIQALVDNNVTALLQIDIGDSGVNEQWVPQTGSTTTTTGTASIYGNTGVFNSTSNTQTYGGYSVSKPWANMQTKLIDVESGKNVWIASSSTGGDGFSDWGTIRNSYCKKIAAELLAAGVW